MDIWRTLRRMMGVSEQELVEIIQEASKLSLDFTIEGIHLFGYSDERQKIAADILALLERIAQKKEKMD